MLVYTSGKDQFLDDVLNDRIENKIEQQMRLNLHHGVGSSEKNSWHNSMQYMYKVLGDEQIPADAGVAIEFAIPQSSKRVDFILTGLDRQLCNNAVIIELKQWSEVRPIADIERLLEAGSTGMKNKIETYLGGGLHITVHPSYQAWSYRTLISDFNASVQDLPIRLQSCAYLHNYASPGVQDPLLSPHFQEYLDEAPVFCKGDVVKLRSFIKKYIHTGDRQQTLAYIEHGAIRPSKSLQDALLGMLQGNREFVLIDGQEVVFQQALAYAGLCQKDGRKRVLIVKGGPGTGKTVVAINLLVSLIKAGQYCAYVTKNSAPRYVFEAKLTQGSQGKRNISNLFKSSGAFIEADTDDFGTLLVDEAHRLNKRTTFGPVVRGEDQIKEIINAARCSVFFIDEAQQVTAQDYGSVGTIKNWATYFGAYVMESELVSQFRCNGSDGYLAWLDNTLGIRTTANPTMQSLGYDFQIIDDPCDLKRLIDGRNLLDGKARLLAGYCWEWNTKRDHAVDADIHIGDFAMKWNLSGDRTFAISAGSIDQVGCIHTAQGLEFSYVGVIVGDDLRFEQGKVITDYTKRAKSDKSLNGLLGKIRNHDHEAMETVDRIIRNTYRTLMTRGMRGCYVYCSDKNLAQYLRESLVEVSAP
ncbi:MAG: DNA/RNA helicase domain-containing protein [Sphaerochaetaceae bacterium]